MRPMNPQPSPQPLPIRPFRGGDGPFALPARGLAVGGDGGSDGGDDAAAELPVVHTLAEFMAVVRLACEVRHAIAGLRLRARREGC